MKPIYETTTVAKVKAAVSKSRTAQHQTSKEGMRLANEDRSELLRNQIEELREEAAALADRAKKTARQAEVLSQRIKHLETQLAKKS
jgi:hypothetical protein